MAGLGLIILVTALFRESRLPVVDVRASISVLLSIAAFAMVIRSFDLIPAITLQTCIAVTADNKLGIREAVLLAGGLSVLAFLIFCVGLSLPVSMFRWPS